MKDIGHFSLVRVNDNIVELTRQNMFGEEASRCFNAKWNEFVPNFQKWMRDEMLIQDAFPDFSADDREFIVTGITPDEDGFAYLDNVVIDGDYTVIETNAE